MRDKRESFVNKERMLVFRVEMEQAFWLVGCSQQRPGNRHEHVFSD